MRDEASTKQGDGMVLGIRSDSRVRLRSTNLHKETCFRQTQLTTADESVGTLGS